MPKRKLILRKTRLGDSFVRIFQENLLDIESTLDRRVGFELDFSKNNISLKAAAAFLSSLNPNINYRINFCENSDEKYKKSKSKSKFKKETYSANDLYVAIAKNVLGNIEINSDVEGESNN